MDKLNNYRQIIERILTDYATKYPYQFGDLHRQLAFDRERDHYLLITVGWDQNGSRSHYVLVQLDIIDGKIWIQRDGIEWGVATELLEARVPKSDIVLAWKPLEIRKLSDFAVG